MTAGEASEPSGSGEKKGSISKEEEEHTETLHPFSPRFEEIKIFQSIIARHEDHSFRVKGWFAAIVGALAAASYSKHIHIPWYEFAFLTFTVYGALVAWLLYHRAITRRGIGRVGELEKGWKTQYSGSKIVDTLSPPLGWREMLGDKVDPQVHFPMILGAIILIVLCLFVAGTPEPNISSTPIPSTGSGTDGGGIAVPTQPGTESINLDKPFIFILILIILGAALTLRPGRVPKAAGILLLLSGLHFALVKEFKVNIERIIDKLTFHIGPNPPPAVGSTPPSGSTPSEQARFGAQYLGGIENFRIGRATIDEAGIDRLNAATTELDKICRGWKLRVDTENAMVLIVGATDRVPLTAANRLRYEANTGLALARASGVRKYLNENCWTEASKSPNSKNVILLVSGPHTTPDEQTERAAAGFPEDRRVDVWALTGIPPGATGTATAPTNRSQARPRGQDEQSSGGGGGSF
jgi:hypothetical protein